MEKTQDLSPTSSAVLSPKESNNLRPSRHRLEVRKDTSADRASYRSETRDVIVPDAYFPDPKVDFTQ
jgi:hypothetical protein